VLVPGADDCGADTWPSADLCSWPRDAAACPPRVRYECFASGGEELLEEVLEEEGGVQVYVRLRVATKLFVRRAAISSQVAPPCS
jgi:hypothetical protein